jgi:primary-amine oxidase
LAQAGTCTVGSAISETLPTGARWDLCWAEHVNEGIVLSEIYYTPPSGTKRKVLHEASLGQIEVRYDDGHAAFNHVSLPGLGSGQLLTLAAAECPDGTLLGNGKRNLLCKQVAPRGYLYKYYTVQRQGDVLTLFSASQIGQMLYVVQWRFFDDGTIEPQVGEGGRLLRFGQDDKVGWPVDAKAGIGIGYVTNFWWRLDFDLGDNGANDYVDEFTVNPTNGNTQLVTSATQLNDEAGRSTDPNVKRSWRVRDGDLTNADGHAISYHLEPKQAGYRYVSPDAEPWSQHDLYATVFHECERLPVANVPVANQADPACGEHVAAFVNGESLAGADIVLWYRLTAHRLPRVEDMPVLGLQWHSYQLLPRDWTAQNPF